MSDADRGVDPDYVEPARTYRTVAATLLVLLVAFGFDALLGGVVTHLPGWIGAAVVILGAHVLFVRAARATHSLTLDADELRVGERAVPREDVVGLVPGIAPSQDVLGWEIAPKNPKGVTLRLRDGRDLGVLTRHADRLAAALGVGAIPERAADPVRPATPADLPLLAEIDERAEAVFRVGGYDLPAIPFVLGSPKAVFVVGDPPEAFASLDEVDGCAYLGEIAVLPGRMRRGLGTRLMTQSCQWARDAGYPAMLLTTYADVPWNAPWYRGLGFREVDELTPGLAAVRERERELGLDAVGRRIVMRLDLRAT